MDEYISRENVLKAFNLIAKNPNKDYQRGMQDTIDCLVPEVIADIPSADVQPIQWISCKDNMPDTLEHGLSTMYSDCCLVCDAFGWVGMAYYITDGQKSWWEFADAQNKNKIDWTEVTHWMPVPEPPKDGDAK